MFNNNFYQPQMQQPMMGATNPVYPPFGQMGYSYAQPVEPLNMTNPLDNIEARKKNAAGKAIEITQEAMDRAICTHRYKNQLELSSTHNPEDPEEQICAICGATFRLIEGASPEQVHQVVRDAIDMLHTIKVMYVNIPDNLCKQLFQIIAVLEQVDKLWGIAAEQYNKYANPYQIGDTTGGINTFGMFNSMMGNMGMGMAQPMMQPMVQQPMQMQPMAQPMMGQPQMNPMMGGQPMMNPMAQQMTAQAPGLNTNGFGVTSAPIDVNVQQPQQAAPAAPANAEAPKVTKQLQA